MMYNMYNKNMNNTNNNKKENHHMYAKALLLNTPFYQKYHRYALMFLIKKKAIKTCMDQAYIPKCILVLHCLD